MDRVARVHELNRLDDALGQMIGELIEGAGRAKAELETARKYTAVFDVVAPRVREALKKAGTDGELTPENEHAVRYWPERLVELVAEAETAPAKLERLTEARKAVRDERASVVRELTPIERAAVTRTA